MTTVKFVLVNRNGAIRVQGPFCRLCDRSLYTCECRL
jgi:hypothetical protein